MPPKLFPIARREAQLGSLPIEGNSIRARLPDSGTWDAALVPPHFSVIGSGLPPVSDDSWQDLRSGPQ
jgi:hypothetical protein